MFPSLDVSLGEHCQLRHVGVEVVDEDTVDVKVWVTAVVDEMRQISIESGVHGVDVLFTRIEIQIEEIGSTLGVVFLASFLSHVTSDDLANILHDKGSSLDVLHGLDPPATAVVGPEDGQLVFSALLHHSVSAVLVTGTPLVTLVQRGPNLSQTNVNNDKNDDERLTPIISLSFPCLV